MIITRQYNLERIRLLLILLLKAATQRPSVSLNFRTSVTDWEWKFYSDWQLFKLLMSVILSNISLSSVYFMASAKQTRGVYPPDANDANSPPLPFPSPSPFLPSPLPFPSLPLSLPQYPFSAFLPPSFPSFPFPLPRSGPWNRQGSVGAL